MEGFIQASIMGFREGLEAFLIIVILLKFLEKTGAERLKKSVWAGTLTGISASMALGALLLWASSAIGSPDTTAKLWESLASLIAVLLVTTFILWMINHGSGIKQEIEDKASLNLSGGGIFLLTLVLVAREGAEISIFTYAGKYPLVPVLAGVAASAAFAYGLHHSLIKIRLNTLFNATLAYLMLQAGFLIGYSVHEGLSAARDLKILDGESILLTKAFDLSGTPLDHKEGAIGVPLYVLFGWYSKPEWTQFALQYGYTTALLLHWRRKNAIRKTSRTE